MKTLIAAFVVALLSLFSGNAAFAASGKAWQLIEFTGDVTLAKGATPVALRQNAKVDAGSVIETGIGGHVVLQRGKELIVIAPNSRMALPEQNKNGFTRILQDAGTAFFQVKKKDKQHFTVETPHLAAVVKGTRFTVDLTAEQPSVFVLDGLVEVADFANQTTHGVAAGEQIAVARMQSGTRPGRSEGVNNPGPNAGQAPKDTAPANDQSKNKSQNGAANGQGPRAGIAPKGPSNAPKTKLTKGVEKAGIDYSTTTFGLVRSANAKATPAAQGLIGKGRDNGAKGNHPTDNKLNSAGAAYASDEITQLVSVAQSNGNGIGPGGTPPGQGGTPPGLGGILPPGQGGSPPGQGGSPPGQGGIPPTLCNILPLLCDE